MKTIEEIQKLIAQTEVELKANYCRTKLDVRRYRNDERSIKEYKFLINYLERNSSEECLVMQLGMINKELDIIASRFQYFEPPKNLKGSAIAFYNKTLGVPLLKKQKSTLQFLLS